MSSSCLSTQDRLEMSRQTWNLFTEKLSDLVMYRVFEDLPVPKIDWSNLVRGMGVLAAVDEVSQTLTKQLVSEITVAEHKFRAWSKNERGIYTSVTAKLPAMLKNQLYGKIMAAVVKLNNLPAEGCMLRKGMTFKDQGDVRLLNIGATKVFLEALQRVEKVRVGICSLSSASMEPRSKQNPTESSLYWYVRGRQKNLRKGHASAAAFQANLTPNLRTGVSGGFPDNNTNSPFLFGLQEPPVYKGKIVGFGSSQKLIYDNKNGDPRAAMYTSRSLHIWPMMEFCDRDTAVSLWKTGNKNIPEIIVVFV